METTTEQPITKPAAAMQQPVEQSAFREMLAESFWANYSNIRVARDSSGVYISSIGV